MDLGIGGRHALICGGSKGLGHAAAESLAREGVNLTIVARSADALRDAAAQLRAEHGVAVIAVPADVTTPEGRAAILAACPDPDILVANPGMRQTPDDFRTLDRAGWDAWMEAHFFASLELIRAVVPRMVERRFGRIVNISVSFIKFPQVNFGHSHAARLALAGAIASMTRELIKDNVVINSVLPGFFDTDALQTNLHGHAARGNTTYEAIVEDRLRTTPAGRFADPAECGDLIAFLCSAQNGYMTGQNIVNDGGVYQGLF
ncbi:SDR family oxidoreductase [Sphingomonas baiyangensis]|uniref:SDR family oxidoreductase n=1 Tax=Sphingomonas baiyangensis TaxID=2572576 RepID=A0A4U1L042_9SPHN|nr:SDR family oxidoreductase [Sphingomonas baiyangensis]TKD49992.1 SDR family oxidoreductase [Sphingomonas baiyangensis]